MDKSTTDWEGIKSQLKKEQKELTKRLSQRQSWDDILESRFIAGLDPEEHFYYKPKATREDTLRILKDMPEGNYYIKVYGYWVKLAHQAILELRIHYYIFREFYCSSKSKK